MKKIIISVFTLVLTSTVLFAQKSNQEIGREYGQKYKEIGTDSSLSGYEKGQKKRELSLQKKQEILNNNKNYDLQNNQPTNGKKSNQEIDREYSQKYKEISTDSSLSGYEKRKKKRELSLQKKQEFLHNNENYDQQNYHSNHNDESDDRTNHNNRDID